ncbi:lipase [Paenibacillus sp. JCM 10914]|nr:lipase [Paenibacillus sp. JCM 10914]
MPYESKIVAGKEARNEGTSLGVGRLVHVFHDVSRSERIGAADDVTERLGRNIVVSVYYPAETGSQEHARGYDQVFSPCGAQAMEMLQEMGADTDLLASLPSVVFNSAEPCAMVHPCPVIVLAPAFGITGDMYTFLVQELVKQGLVVVAISTVGESMFTVLPDGQFRRQAQALRDIESTDGKRWNDLLETRVADILYVTANLSELARYFPDSFIRYHQVGLVGHSLGGAAVVEALQRESAVRFYAAMLFDPSFHLMEMYNELGIDIPLLLMRQEACTREELQPLFSEQVLEPFIQGYKDLYFGLTGFRSSLKVQGAGHMTFSDIPVLFNEGDVTGVQQVISRAAIAFVREFVQGQHLAYRNEMATTGLIGEVLFEIDALGHDDPGQCWSVQAF